MAFFCFLLVFGIGTFQRVTGEKSEKNFPPPQLASRVVREAPQGHGFIRSPVGSRAGPPPGEACVALLIRNMISTPSQFWKVNVAADSVRHWSASFELREGAPAFGLHATTRAHLAGERARPNTPPRAITPRPPNRTVGRQPSAAAWAGPESLPLASTSRSTNSITAIAALSPGRNPAFMIRV